MFSQQHQGQYFSQKQELFSIAETLKTIAPRIHFYCSRKITDKEQQDIIQIMLNYYANRLNQLEKRLETLKNDSDPMSHDSALSSQWDNLLKKITANKKYLMQHLIAIKPIESGLQIEHSTKPKTIPVSSSPSLPNQTLFKKHTGALAATTAATLTLGYLYLKHS